MPRSQTTRVSWEPTYTHVKASATETLAAVQNARVTELHAAVPLANATQDLSHGVPVMPDYVAPDENAAGVFTIDLSPSCNMGFADDTAGDGRGGWSDEGPLNDMRCLPPGKRRFYGVPFVIIDPALNKGKSVITLRSRTSSQTLPESVAVTFAPRRCRALYFLHASAWGTPGEIGEYTVTYADEQIAHLPLTIPGNTGNWWTPPQDGETGRTVPVRVDNTPSGTPEWRYLRVWEWQNPRRNVPIHRIDVHAGKGKQMPILIAVTGV